MGEQVLSDQSIYQIISTKAQQVSRVAKAEALGVLEQTDMPCIQSQIDLYDQKSEEVLLFEDGIQVKGQKLNRLRKATIAIDEFSTGGLSTDGLSTDGLSSDKVCDNRNTKRGKTKRYTTDIVSLQRKDGSYLHFTNDLEDQVDLCVYIKAAICAEYSNHKELSVVSIIDGASTIRRHLKAALGEKVVYILDWYHLRKKCNELLSMIAFGRAHREQLATHLLHLCWMGQVHQAIEHLKALSKVRNVNKHQELIKYLTKHQTAIINYEKRQQAGKTIGSGRMESVVNEAIGRRQKDNGMAWSQKGSKSLAILKIQYLNQQWDKWWTPNIHSS